MDKLIDSEREKLLSIEDVIVSVLRATSPALKAAKKWSETPVRTSASPAR